MLAKFWGIIECLKKYSKDCTEIIGGNFISKMYIIPNFFIIIVFVIKYMYNYSNNGRHSTCISLFIFVQLILCPAGIGFDRLFLRVSLSHLVVVSVHYCVFFPS